MVTLKRLEFWIGGAVGGTLMLVALALGFFAPTAPARLRTPLATDSLIDPRSDWVTTYGPNTTFEPYWNLVGYTYLDETQSGGRVNIYVTVLDTDGAPVSGAIVHQGWPDGSASQPTIGGTTDFPMSGDSSFDPKYADGPYWVYVENQDHSKTVDGLGLPLKRHVVYMLTFRKENGAPLITPTPTPHATPTLAPYPPPDPGCLTPRDLASYMRMWAYELEVGSR